MKRSSVLMLSGIVIMFFSCQSGLDKKELIGKWRVTDMQVDIPNVPDQLIEDARTLSLSTIYDFNADMTFQMTIAKNEIENGRKQMGEIKINKQLLTLVTDTVFLRNRDDEWVNIDKKRGADFFDPIPLTLEKKSADQMTLSEKEGSGKIYYTLNRIE
ncbi:MAG: hypothetical protein AAFX87_30315 [Bacteroidota bacterium]